MSEEGVDGAPTESGSYEALSEDGRRFLLANEEIGRIAFLDEQGCLVVLPVNDRLHGDTIVLRTAAGSKLDRVRHQCVAFEVDRLETSVRSGWSVLVQGVGTELASADATDGTAEVAIRPWSPGRKQHVLAISIETISGRQIANPRALVPSR